MLFEFKQSQIGILDLLRMPSSDQNLRLFYTELGLDKSFKTLLDDGSSRSVMNMTLLDQILQMIVDYIVLLNKHAGAFELQETQTSEFNRWKQEILQNLCLILQQLNVRLNILERRKQGDPAKHERQ